MMRFSQLTNAFKILKKAVLVLILFFAVNPMFAQLGDNGCADAHGTTPGNSETINLFNTTGSTTWPATCESGAATTGDVWLTFRALYTTHTVTVFDAGAAINVSALRLQIFNNLPNGNNCTAGAATVLGCNKNQVTVSGLTVGNFYKVRLSTSQTTTTLPNDLNAYVKVAVTPSAEVQQAAVTRTREVFSQKIISAPNAIDNPWEVTEDRNGALWVTESKGGRLFRFDPITGARDTVLDVSWGSTFLPIPDTLAFNLKFNGQGAQGGFAGMALHPDFLAPTNPKNFVYVGYVRQRASATNFTNVVARFTYNPATKKCGSPVMLINNLPGSNDHNSQRMIIAPVVANGAPFLFYSSGDMGGGQFDNVNRALKTQDSSSNEGTIMRFNLESDGDAGANAWIPNDNPYNRTVTPFTQYPAYSIGHRNVQGLAYNPKTHTLYGSSHGPYSDDEINILERRKNYGHPRVVGYKDDGNYNNITVGGNNSFTSSAPRIWNEKKYAEDTIGMAFYKDPLFSAYQSIFVPPSTTKTAFSIWNLPAGNPWPTTEWPSEGWSGLGYYNKSNIPTWKNSLINCGLKFGRLIRIRTNDAGTAIQQTMGADTAIYLQSTNRYRDIAIADNGLDFYIVNDKSSASSGPTNGSNQVQACAGCILKYSFLGYATNVNGKSELPNSTLIATGTTNNCLPANTININSTNNNLWVPITDTTGAIIAEIKANGNNLGNVTTSYYLSNTIRQRGSRSYLNRNITITPQNQPATPVSVRFYITAAEFNTLDAAANSNVASINDIKIAKNPDVCRSTLSNITDAAFITPTFAEAWGSNYVLQANISGFSSFYFGNFTGILPLQLVSFTANKTNNNVAVNFVTANETSVSSIVLETEDASGNFIALQNFVPQLKANNNLYSYNDVNANFTATPVVRYRLKFVNAFGVSTYSQVITVSNINSNKQMVTVYPNPFAGTTMVTIVANENEPALLEVIDITGKIVSSKNITLIKGTNNKEIDLSAYAAGSYTLRVVSASIKQSTKIQKN
jgi:trimeric autotransporter adhesin